MARSQGSASWPLPYGMEYSLPANTTSRPWYLWSQEYDVGAENEMCVAAKKGASSPLGSSAYTSTSRGQGLFLNHPQNRNR